jgi:hypothetical protein
LRLALPAIEPFLAENVAKEARKDALVIARAEEALSAGAPPGAAVVRELLAAGRDIDREFLKRTAGFPVRIEIRYAAIEPPRLRRIELGLDTAWRILDAWRRGRGVREAFSAEQLERRLFDMLKLYAEETQALSHSVRLPGILAPLREHLAQRLREEMVSVARALARDVALRNRRAENR